MMPPRLSKQGKHLRKPTIWPVHEMRWKRSEEHTSELQSQSNLVCRLLLEKKTDLVRALRNVETLTTRGAVPETVRRLFAPFTTEQVPQVPHYRLDATLSLPPL